MNSQCNDNEVQREQLQVTTRDPLMSVNDKVLLLKTQHEAERKEAERKRKQEELDRDNDGPHNTHGRKGTTAGDAVHVQEGTAAPKHRRTAATNKARNYSTAKLTCDNLLRC